jgi:DNA repair exonuclease SbcCD nuclease subunit
MATFRFLHCADLHLDSPLRGLEADPEAPVDKIRGATREALKNLVDFAVEQRLDFVVAAGDLYDGDWQDWRTGQFLIGQIARLSNAGIPLVAIRGNHDAASVITNRLRMPGENARLLDHKQPETFRLPDLRVAIHGQSFATRAVTDNVALAYPPPVPGWFNIGLLHSSVGERELHDNYAPCSVEQLRAHDYDYWALGHVHEREVLSRDPWIVFPGNLQGRHVNETGPKGGTLVIVTDGKIVDVSHESFDTVRWARIPIFLAKDADEDIALTQVRAALAAEFEQAGGRLLAARITLSGACVAHDSFVRDLGAAREKVRAEALAVSGPGMIWTETVEIATSPVTEITAERDRTGAIGQLIRALETIRGDDILDDVRTYAASMLDKANPLRAAIGEEHAAAKAANDEIPESLRRRAEDLLLGSLDG